MYDKDVILSSIKDIKTCLKPSRIQKAGIGVFALRKIKKDEILYDRKYYQDLIDHEIPATFIDKIVEPKIAKFIERMCMYNYENDTYIIDIPLNMLYTEYYINHSHTPNMFWDRQTSELYAIHDIEEGEELTTYYRPDERDWELA